MASPIFRSYANGYKILNNNLYLFWVDLACIILFTYMSSTTVAGYTWLLILTPFLIITVKLAETKLLYDLPKNRHQITETYVIVLYKFFLKIAGLYFCATILGITIYVLSGGSMEMFLALTRKYSSPDVTLLQKMITSLPLSVILLISSFLKIFWVVKKQSFFQSVSSALLLVYKNLTFSIVTIIMNILLFIIPYTLTQYLNQPNSLVTIVLNTYLGLLLTSAAIDYFKSYE